MSITRVADVDDDGSGTTGTLIDDAFMDSVWDALDARWSEASTTSTGNQDNFNYSEADVLRCNNATTITLRGLLAPTLPAKPGKRLLIVSVGAGSVVLNDQDTNSTAANRIITGFSAAITLTAGTGFAWVEYDATTSRWRLVGSSVTSNVQTTTLTGTQNNLAITAGCSVLRCNNASLLTLTGLAAGFDGQRIVIVSIGAGQVDLAHQNASSSAANRLINFATSGNTSLAAGVGTAEIEYDLTSTRWRLVSHEQGAAIDYSGTSTIVGWSARTTSSIRYYLRGRQLSVQWALDGTSNSTSLTFTLPYTFIAMASALQRFPQGGTIDNGAYLAAVGTVSVTNASAVVTCYTKNDTTAWTAANEKFTSGSVTFEVG